MGSTLAPGRTTSNAVDRAVAFPLAPPEDIPSGEGLLSLRETFEHVGAKRFVLAKFRFDEVEHQASPASRRPENCHLASGGKKLR
jgi:hypothetical protein